MNKPIFGEWQDIETAPRDGSRILTKNVTPTWDEDEKKMVVVKAISVAYWLFGDWMEYPANPDEDGEEEKANTSAVSGLGEAVRKVRGGDAPKPKRGFA
jgi:predicted lysophospholipase L1 biosynthesis ABC-type transport system permease subunit